MFTDYSQKERWIFAEHLIYIFKCMFVVYSQNVLGIFTKRALAWYGKLTWESVHAWILKILCYLIVWRITLMGAQWLSGRVLDSRPKVRASPASLRCGP